MRRLPSRGSRPQLTGSFDVPLVGCCPREVAQFGSALRSGRRGRGFKSPLPDDTRATLKDSGSMHVNVTLDCNDLDRVVAFWEQVLGYATEPTVPGRYVSLTPPDGNGFTLTLQRVDETKLSKNRMHLDVLVHDLRSEVQRVEALGATRLTALLEDYGERWYIMADPEGNEFCLAELPAPPD
jgi:predicted enzyme related to lactoylglutathione lyase